MILKHTSLRLAIGLVALATQQLQAQEVLQASVFQLKEHAEELKARLKRAFDPAQPVGWKDGWRLAQDAGPLLTPFLAEQLRQENRVQRRLLWIGALVLCSGGEQDDTLLAMLSGGKRTEEKVFTAFALALVGARLGSGEPLLRHLADTDEEIVCAAFALALARHPERSPGASIARLLASDDPALAAAGISATGRDASAAQAAGIERWFKERADFPRAELVRRATYLNDALTTPDPRTWALPTWTQSARQQTKTPVAVAAALCLARRANPKTIEIPKDAVPSSACLIALCSDPAWRNECLSRGWLVPVPKLVAFSDERRRLASAYALAAGIERLRQDREFWQRDRETAGTIVKELALQVLSARIAGTQPEPFFVEAGDPAERAWLDFAFGNHPLASVGTSSDAQLQRVLQAATSDLLPPRVAAQELEAGLVRSGVRADSVRSEAFRLLVRDVLLLGSRQGSKRYAQGHEAVGLPRGIPPDRDDFFATACEFYEFVTRSVPELAPRSLPR